jgi:5-aminolevulinate synthase
VNYQQHFERAIARLKLESRYRVFADLERCSNDYLGMGVHAKVVEAAIRAVKRHGAGAGGTRNISGTHHPIVELKAELADLHGKQAALAFTSGWISNLASVSTIARLLPDCLILSDALNHSSIVEGVRRSGCEKQIWRHNDLAHLEELLFAAGPERASLIVFESLYSMDGDIRRWPGLSTLPKNSTR